MIHELIQLDKSVAFQYGRVLNHTGRDCKNLLDVIDSYLTEYVDFYKLSLDETLRRYFTFVDRYVSDLKAFESTGLFPFQDKNSEVFCVERVTYDIFLILSSLLQKHRFRIMKNISEAEKNSGNCLIVGAGSGLEMFLLRDKFKNIDAYDISISDFCKYKFGDLNLLEEEYDACCENKYDAIYAIEILEHLISPYGILNSFSKSLKTNGRLIVTTAKNVPQYDHLFNFSDDYKFETRVKNMDFNILYKEVIKHNYVFFQVDSSNIFYILKKFCNVLN